MDDEIRFDSKVGIPIIQKSKSKVNRHLEHLKRRIQKLK
jgi:hypothetical protein